MEKPWANPGISYDDNAKAAPDLVTPDLSIIVPVFNEADNIREMARRLCAVLDKLNLRYEILFVDDGSQDETWAVISELGNRHGPITGLSFSRNFGKEIAIAAGLDHATGRAAVLMDADLQHPPELIETFVDYWRQGYKNVFGQRTHRSADSFVRRVLTERFYQIFESFGELRLPNGAGDFRLLDRQAIDALRSMRESARFNKGLFAWIGFKSIGVPFDVAERIHGTTKFSYRKLTRFAFDGLISFSTLPLKIWTYVGTVVSVAALTMAVFFVTRTIALGVDVPGYASLIVSVLFFAGMQLMSLGIIGEYVGRIFAEVKRRPLYIVAERTSPEKIGKPEAVRHEPVSAAHEHSA
jgi:polyisoprenyl-phosphate glycosyltransferase